MSDKPEAVAVGAVLEALRAEVRALRSAADDAEAGTSVVERELRYCAEQLEMTRVVSAHWPLQGKNLYERAWVQVHRVVRRALQWYIPPIVAQQNAFNDTAARALRLLIEANAELRAELVAMQHQRDQSPPSDSSASDAAPADTQPLADPAAAAPDAALRALTALAAERVSVNGHWALTGATPLGRARAFTQKGLRQYLRWMINPLIEQQNAANAAIAAALPHLVAANAELRASLTASRAAQDSQV